jgi:putative SOS response-associated peptidase YedK
MCGPYASFLPAEAVARLFHTVNLLPNLPPTWNMTPTQDAMVVRHHPETGERHLDLWKWGLLPYFTNDPMHARRPINAAPRPYRHQACSGRRSPSAALWEGFRWPEGTVLRTFIIIITTDANPMMVEPHHWMPVILDQRIGQRGWTRLRATPPTLLQPADEDVLKVWPVSKQVNSPQNNCPELLKGGGTTSLERSDHLPVL